MILVSAPLRVSLFGGGSDIESFYSVNGGAFLSLSIKSRIYLAINKTINNEIKIHYSQTEIVKDVNTIKHDLVREALKLMGITGDLEIGSFADIPTSGTGLGSSSTFSVALLGGLNVLCGHSCSARDLAEQACHLEIDLCSEPIGKQDQYAAAFGGLNFYEIDRSGYVKVEKNIIGRNVEQDLVSRLFMVYTGKKRDASDILTEQTSNVAVPGDKRIAQQSILDMAYESYDYLRKNELDNLGRMLGEAWEQKKKLASAVSNVELNAIYEKGIEAGSLGGKLLGAGGGGFFLFYVPPDRQNSFCQAFNGEAWPVELSQEGFLTHYGS